MIRYADAMGVMWMVLQLRHGGQRSEQDARLRAEIAAGAQGFDERGT